MATAEFVNVYPYREEVVVEIAVRGPETDIGVRSFHFEYTDEDRLAPKERVEAEFEADVQEALEKQGYALEAV